MASPVHVHGFHGKVIGNLSPEGIAELTTTSANMAGIAATARTAEDEKTVEARCKPSIFADAHYLPAPDALLENDDVDSDISDGELMFAIYKEEAKNKKLDNDTVMEGMEEEAKADPYGANGVQQLFGISPSSWAATIAGSAAATAFLDRPVAASVHGTAPTRLTSRYRQRYWRYT